MALAFLLIIISSVSLAFMGAIPVWTGGSFALGAFVGLIAIGVIEQQGQRHLRRRGRQLQARWGLPVRHLGGLPLPLETPGNLFLLKNQLILESEHDQLRVPLDNLRKILLLNSVQIRKLSDRQLADMLESESERSFMVLRDKVHHHDNTVYGHGLIMITYDLENDETRLLVLASSRRLPAIIGLFANPILPGDRIRLLEPNGKTESPVL